MAANGTALDTGQASLVRQMCTSGARLQLAIAPAGAGKTTAMRALTLAWTEDGGQVIGLAPSAAAAAVLGEQTGIRTDTLAKLTWSLRNGDLPDWATGVGPATLIIIDEAGMADTLSLDTAVRFAIDRGASVRLVGDDQQLAAIGAGGVLRDIKNIHGALQLTELHRFTDPAEAQASLALREGDPGALGFYLDHGRVHVGDLAKITEDAFAAWVSDRAVGLDAIMLAPTRELVAELNRRARDHRLDGAPAGQEVRLGDGNRASVGDMIITRANDRRLRLSATDWVKNGDRWTITHVDRSGGLTVRHSRSQLTVQLPADYVTTSTGLGYATTIHGAQGVSADTMHGLLTGQESRQQLYTMLTRGRHANHLYLQVVGDGDPHSLIRPDTISPRTPTETLQQILARDEAPVSASTVLRRAQRPSGPALPGGPALHRRPPRRSRTAPRTPDRRRARPSRPIPPRTHHRTRLANPASPPARPRGRNRRAPTPPPADSRQPDATSKPQATWPPSSTGASQSSRLPTQVRCPGSRAFHQRCMPIPSGGPTWQSDPSWSPTSPTRSKTTPAKVTPSQSGLHRELTRAPPSSAKSQCGGPPTASIPKTRDQPEEPNSKRSRPSGNNASTGISPIPPIRQTMRGPTSDRQHTPHLDAGTTTASARTKNPNGVRAGRPHPADSTPQSSDRGARNMRMPRGDGGTGRTGSTLPNLALFRSRAALRRPGGACPRSAAGRAASLTRLGLRQRCVEFVSVSVDVCQVGREDIDVSCGEALLLDRIAGLGSGDDVVDLPALTLNDRVEYLGAEVTSVVVHEPPQPARLIGRDRVRVGPVGERNEPIGRLREVPQPRPGPSPVEIDKADYGVTAIDAVVRGHVTVTDDLYRLPHPVQPRSVDRRDKPNGRVVIAAQQSGGLIEYSVGPQPLGKRVITGLTLDITEHLSALPVHAQNPRCSVETDRLQMTKQRMHRGCPASRAAPDRVTDPNRPGLPAAAQRQTNRLLGTHLHVLSYGSAAAPLTAYRSMLCPPDDRRQVEGCSLTPRSPTSAVSTASETPNRDVGHPRGTAEDDK